MSGLGIMEPAQLLESANAFAGLGALFCADENQVRANGFAGLGYSGNQELTVSSVLDGSAYAELRQAKNDSNARAVEAGQLLNAAQATGDTNAISYAQQAVNGVGQERNSLYQAINAYSGLANTIQTVSYGYYKPQQLSGLGIAPVVIGALLLSAAVLAAAEAFSIAMSAYRGDAAGSQSYIQQARDAINAVGGAIKNAGDAIQQYGDTALKVGLVGIGGYILIKMLQTSGWKMPFGRGR